MQASKIVPGRVYAVKRDNTLMRFTVHEIVTTMRRKGPKANPHDYTSEVEGHYLEGDRKTVSLDPDKLLGEYTEYEELVAVKAKADAAAKAKADAEQDAARDVAAMLFKLTGQAVPKDMSRNNYGLMFRQSWNDVQISKEGVALLRSVLRDLTG